MINVFGSNINQEELEEIKSSLSWMGMGRKVEQFEQSLSERIGSGIVMLDSGSNALHLATHLLNLRGNVIVPSLAWVSCASAITLSGLKPNFCDVDEETQNITIESIERVINKDTSAIMVIHYAGKPVNIPSLRKFGLPIIEDAAHAIDSKLDGKHCGTFGDVAIFSFDSVKNLATPEGGAICSNSYLLEKAREYRYCGVNKSGFSNQNKSRWWEHEINHIWHKMIPNDISASVGLSQLKKLDKHQQIRKSIWNRYQSELNLPWIKRPVDPEPNEQHSYFTYLIRVERRDELANYLLKNDVYTTFRYHSLHLNKIYNDVKSLPVCEKLNKCGLNLPLHPKLENKDVDKIIDLIRKF